MEHGLKIRFLGYEESRLRPLNDAKAVDTGANFLSELLIFSVATLTIVGETYRSSRKSSLRDMRVDQSLVDINKSCAEWDKSFDELAKRWQATEEKLEAFEKSISKLTLPKN